MLRKKFNNGPYASLAGLRQEPLRPRRPLIDFIQRGEPEGTVSDFVRCFLNGYWVVEVHQYIRPDGTIGGAGRRPDPKRLREDGIMYAVPDKPRNLSTADKVLITLRANLKLLSIRLGKILKGGQKRLKIGLPTQSTLQRKDWLCKYIITL